jgi:hypothetical protein
MYGQQKNNKTMTARNTQRSLLGGACMATGLAVAVLPSLAASAPWEFGAEAELGVIYTDNVLLAPADEESETVYTISPSFFLRTDGERTQADIRYRPQAYFYQDVSDEDTVYHLIDASMTTALVRDRLFLYLSGVNFQTSITPDGSLPTSNLSVTGNRTDSRILEARPSWRQRVGNADLLLAAGIRDLDYDGDDLQSTSERYGNFDLSNFTRQEGLAWGISYDYRRMEYERSSPFEFQRAELNLGYWVSGTLRLFGAGGAESSFDNPLEANLDEDFWEAGFQYAPNQRLNLEVAAGERSYGTSLRGDLSYTLRRGTLSLNYSETPTSRSDTLFDTRPIVDGDDLDNILNRAGNADRFVRKRGEFRAEIELAKSNFTFRAFVEQREDRRSETGMPLADEELSGVAARWDWRFGPKTNFDVAVDLASRDDVSRDDDLTRFSLGVDYTLTARTSLRFEGTRAEQEGNTSSEFDYVENQLRLLVSVQLR